MGMTSKRKSRTLRPFIFLGNEKRILEMGFARKKGQCRMILDILRSKPTGYEWTSREVCDLLEKHPHFKTSTHTFRVANFYLWKFKYAGIVKWADE
jgi:hypothetical protein